jgi:hypothetical protein
VFAVLFVFWDFDIVAYPILAVDSKTYAYRLLLFSKCPIDCFQAGVFFFRIRYLLAFSQISVMSYIFPGAEVTSTILLNGTESRLRE